MSRKRILPRGGDGIWWVPILLTALAGSFFMSAGMWYFGIPVLAVTFWCVSRVMDFADLYRD